MPVCVAVSSSAPAEASVPARPGRSTDHQNSQPLNRKLACSSTCHSGTSSAATYGPGACQNQMAKPCTSAQAMGRRLARCRPRHKRSMRAPNTARHCGNGRASTSSGATTAISSMCCTMCQAALLSAISSSGPNSAIPVMSMAPWNTARAPLAGRRREAPTA